jgi:hypothetical protein
MASANDLFVTAGLTAVRHELTQIQKEIGNTIKGGLKEAAEIVRVDASGRFSAVYPPTARGFRSRVRYGSKWASTYGVAYVEQSKRRTTGRHPEYGPFQMRRALEPALAANEGKIVDILDKAVGDLVGD